MNFRKFLKDYQKEIDGLIKTKNPHIGKITEDIRKQQLFEDTELTNWARHLGVDI